MPGMQAGLQRSQNPEKTQGKDASEREEEEKDGAREKIPLFFLWRDVHNVI